VIHRLVLIAGLALLPSLAHAQAEAAPPASADDSSQRQGDLELPTLQGPFEPGKPPPVVKRIVFQGNRKVEDDATQGQPHHRGRLARRPRQAPRGPPGPVEDGFLRGRQGDRRAGGRRRPDHHLRLHREAVDPAHPGPGQRRARPRQDKRGHRLKARLESSTVTKIKKNTQKIKDLYISKGYYLASVDYQVRPVNESEVDVWLTSRRTPRSRSAACRSRKHKITDDQLRSIMARRRAASCLSSTTRGPSSRRTSSAISRSSPPTTTTRASSP